MQIDPLCPLRSCNSDSQRRIYLGPFQIMVVRILQPPPIQNFTMGLILDNALVSYIMLSLHNKCKLHF